MKPVVALRIGEEGIAVRLFLRPRIRFVTVAHLVKWMVCPRHLLRRSVSFSMRVENHDNWLVLLNSGTKQLGYHENGYSDRYLNRASMHQLLYVWQNLGAYPSWFPGCSRIEVLRVHSLFCADIHMLLEARGDKYDVALNTVTMVLHEKSFLIRCYSRNMYSQQWAQRIYVEEFIVHVEDTGMGVVSRLYIQCLPFSYPTRMRTLFRGFAQLLKKHDEWSRKTSGFLR